MIRVLVGCECSGVIREAFRRLGADAWSCDLKPAKDGSPFHILGDVLEVGRREPWDRGILHPPCQDLTVSCSRLWDEKRRDGRQTRAIRFFMDCWELPIPCLCLENPVGIMSSEFRPPNQYIQPYEFGDDASKKTGLWLRGLPELVKGPYFPPRIVIFNGKKYKRWSNQTDSGQNRLGQSPERAAVRAETYPGIARAMAAQWLNPFPDRLLDWEDTAKNWEDV